VTLIMGSYLACIAVWIAVGVLKHKYPAQSLRLYLATYLAAFVAAGVIAAFQFLTVTLPDALRWHRGKDLIVVAAWGIAFIWFCAGEYQDWRDNRRYWRWRKTVGIDKRVIDLTDEERAHYAAWLHSLKSHG